MAAHSDDDGQQQQQQQRRKSHDKRGQKQLCRRRVLNKYRISRGGIIPTFTGQKDGNNGVTRSEDGSLLQMFSEQT